MPSHTTVRLPSSAYFTSAPSPPPTPYIAPSGPTNANPDAEPLSPFTSTGLPSAPTLYVFLLGMSVKYTSPFALAIGPSVNLYPSPTSFQSSPGISTACICGDPLPALIATLPWSFHSHFMASGKICVACWPLCPPNPFGPAFAHWCSTSYPANVSDRSIS